MKFESTKVKKEKGIERERRWIKKEEGGRKSTE